MAEVKTQATKQNPKDFLNAIEPEQKKKDGFVLLEIFQKATGFGKYHYKSERSAQEGDWPLIGFSPRKQNLTLYIMGGRDDVLLKKLGKHKLSGGMGGCLYINKLSDVDITVLTEVVRKSFQYMKKAKA